MPCPTRLTPVLSLKTSQAVPIDPDCTLLHPMGLPYHIPGHGQNPPQNEIPMFQRLGALYLVTWPSHDDCATTYLAGHLVGGPAPWEFILFHLFLSYCKLMLLWLLHSGCIHTYSHSQLGDWMYVLLCHVHALMSLLPMWTAAVVTDTLQPLFQ